MGHQTREKTYPPSGMITSTMKPWHGPDDAPEHLKPPYKLEIDEGETKLTTAHARSSGMFDRRYNPARVWL